MADSHDRAADKLVDDFGERIATLRSEGVSSYPPLGGRTPWAETMETRKLDEIVWESWTVSHGGTTPGTATLEAIERNVDYRGLPTVQAEMLRDLRTKLDAGLLDGRLPDGRDLAGIELARIVGVGHFDESLQEWKADADRPWAEVPEDVKVRVLVDVAQETGPPGTYTLAAIEREVDYSKLPPWRRAALEDLRAQLDRGELGGEQFNPIYQGDRVDYALRLAELEARIEDYKRIGALDANGARRPWRELSEEQKLYEIELEIDELNLGSAASVLENVAREEYPARVPDEQRREFEDSRAEAWPRPGQAGEREGERLPSPGDIAREDGPTFREIRNILAERRQVAIFWTVDDVQAVRPDLDEDQAWKLLQQVEHDHDGDYGITFDSIESASRRLFPNPGPLPAAAVEPEAGGQAEGNKAASSRYIIVPYGDDNHPFDPMLEPCDVENAELFRVFYLSPLSHERMAVGDFPAITEAWDFLKTAGLEGQLLEAEAFNDLPAFGPRPDVTSLRAGEEPQAKPLPSPGEIADSRDGLAPPAPDRGKGRGL